MIYYHRKLLPEIMKYIEDREAIVIFGSRQVGKTTILRIITENLREKMPIVYLDLENLNHLSILEDGIDSFLNYLDSLDISRETRILALIDEFQYLNDSERFLKLLVDHHSSRVKLILTGSSPLKLGAQFTNHVAGRKFTFTLHPLDFQEYLIFKGEDQLAKILPENPFEADDRITRFHDRKYEQYLKEFIIFGGYPRVALENSYEKKTKILEEIVSSFILKDIREFSKIESIDKVSKLLRFIALSCGELFNKEEASSIAEISRPTVDKYLDLVELSFILKRVRPFYRSAKTEIKKRPKVFIFDNGIRNVIIGNMLGAEKRMDKGALLENAVFSGLEKHRRFSDRLFYMRTKAKAEVDFVIEGKDARIIPLEVKWRGKPTKGLHSFMSRYKLEKGYLAHMAPYRKEANVVYVPAWWLC
jgi:predicted AAA+ superfamily ATPase